MLKISQIKTRLDQPLNKEIIARKLKCREEDILSFTIDRQSLDSRFDEISYVYSVYAEVKNEVKYLKRKDVLQAEKEDYDLPSTGAEMPRPLIVGFGPAGMFAGLILAECGYKPLIIERGKAVEERVRDIELFFREGVLDQESNIQYGEGGAGTFSDGKLTTRIKNVRIQKVLQEFVEAGAEKEILYQAMPHIGTDILRRIVRNIREKIIRLGGEIRFNTRLEQLIIQNQRIVGVSTSQGIIDCTDVLLCTGHSARDTYQMLYDQGIEIIQKDFAAGFRVEHPQYMVDQNQYGKYAGHPLLGPASYRLTHTTSNHRGVYSFCMCPGGIVVPSPVIADTLVVNGMSYSDRGGDNANSAILVQIPTGDFDHGHPLDGFIFQEQLERNAYYPGYAAPAQNITDYINRQRTSSLVIPSSYPRDTVFTDMHDLFTEVMNLSFHEAFINFDHKIPGFIQKGIMIGMESRSSSPIRMVRSNDGMCVSCAGLFPCGEGPGYAGGIVSSAVDGIKQAENLIHRYL